ncbi:MAG: hypothetical protein IT495_22440 [Gammaproteobacteria bacterium]|nr:hypothetical protein [Gammaproteobacteria bacterium]
MTVLGACGGDRTPANKSAAPAQQNMPGDSSTLLAQQKMYISFEVTLTGERKFGERVPADALSDVAWRLNRSVKGEIPLDMPMPGSVPASTASDNSNEMMEEGRYIGWMAAPPEDPSVMEQIMAGKLEISKDPTSVPVEFRIDDEAHQRSRDFPSQPFGTTSDKTIQGSGKVYTSKGGVVACDLKMKICDISGFLATYTDGTDLVSIAEMSSYPGDRGRSLTRDPAMMLPRIGPALGQRLAGIEFESSGPISTSFSEPYPDRDQINDIPVGADSALIVTVKVTVSPRPALGTSKAK